MGAPTDHSHVGAAVDQQVDVRKVCGQGARAVWLCGDRRQRAVKICRQEQLARPHIAQPRKRRLQVTSLDGRSLFADALESDQRRKQFIHVLWTTLRSALLDLANVSKMEPIVERELNKRGAAPIRHPEWPTAAITRSSCAEHRRRFGRMQEDLGRRSGMRLCSVGNCSSPTTKCLVR